MIVFLTGAGISTAAGIPDYRGPDGTWKRDPDAARLVTYNLYVSDPEIRRRSWRFRATSPAWSAQPTAAHRAIATIPDAWVITQNVDELHLRAGTASDHVVQLHGTMFRTVCLDCGETGPTRAAIERIDAGDADPPCEVCGGILKPATVMFGESLDEAVLGRAIGLAQRAEVFVVVGTSLQVYPATSLVRVAKLARARVIIVNGEPTDYDDIADQVIREPIDGALPQLIQQAGWADPPL